MRINRKLVLLGMFALSLGICLKVTSYTYAKIENSMNIIISPSQDALIAMPDEIDINVKKEISEIITLTDDQPADISKAEPYEGNMLETLSENHPIYVSEKETLVTTTLESYNFTIQNNMNQTIVVNIDLQNGFGEIHHKGLFNLDNTFDSISILPGEQQEVPIQIDDSIETESFEVKITATWNGGSAQINKKVNIDVEIINIEEVADNREEIVQKSTTEEEEDVKIKDNAESNDKDQNMEEPIDNK